MTGLVAAGAAVVGAWTVLIGAAFAVRRLRYGRMASAGLVLACYAGLAAAASDVLGSGWRGFAGAGGMLLPFAMSLALVVLL